ncbi:MAG: ABC transporter permease [Actinomycetota bacterium]|nr:ABC transporter permease [Actinomycetota bacterium]
MDSFLAYLSDNQDELVFYARSHFLLVLYSVGIATVVSVALALVLHTNRLTPPSWSRSLRSSGQEGLLLAFSAALTVPSLALFGLLQPILGLGTQTAVVGLAIYGLYPVLRNTVAGLSSVDPAVLEAAKGVGMGPTRRMVRIQLPLAAPVIISGIRVAVLIMIGIAVVAAIISDVGFGELVDDGLKGLGTEGAFTDVMVGTFACLLVAAVFEIIFGIIQRFVTPRGIRV